jgi:cytochrome c peroxidase
MRRLLVLCTLTFVACGEPAVVLTDGELALLETLSPETLPGAPPDVSNAFADDPRAARFGQRLFFDPLFSGALLDGDNDGSDNALGHQGETGKVSCAGCHVPRDGFSDTRSLRQQISLGAGWGRRRTPSLLDVAQSVLFTWGGKSDTLYNQVFPVFESAVEMNSSRLYVAQEIARRHRAEYEAIFGALPPFEDTARFPPLGPDETGCRLLTDDRECTTVLRGAPGDGAEYDGMTASDQDAVTRVVVHVGKAIGAYERLLTCGESRFDSFLRGELSALTVREQRGAALFVGRGHCITCHSGPFLSDEQFHNVGLKPEVVATVFLDDGDRGAATDLAFALASPLNVEGMYSDGDDGRLPTAVQSQHEGAFRTPRLRCVASRPAYMHTGHMRTLEEVVAFFNRGGEDYGYPGTNELSPLGLSPDERDDLVAFLRALEGPGPAEALLVPPP